MASEQVPIPATPPRRVPRGVADLPVREAPPDEATTPSVTVSAVDLTGFKPRRRARNDAFAIPQPEAQPPAEGPSPEVAFRSRRVSSSPSPAAVPAPEGRQGRGERPAVAGPPGSSRRQPAGSARRLIVNADDFGRSRSINQAVIRAHREGILTTASLMVNGEAFDEAVELAQQNPTLGVGLHLTLICGKATCGRMEIPDLVNPAGEFSRSPVTTGTRYFFDRSLRLQLAREIGAQFAKFKATGLTLDHVNGHLNMHLHPTVFELLAARSLEWGIHHMRVTDDPFALNRRLAGGQWLYRASHAFIFGRLARRARRVLARSNIRFTDHVFGLLQNARVDETFIVKLLNVLPRGDSELYSHPSLDEFRHEFDALVSPRVKAQVQQLGIQLVRYQDL